MKGKKSDPEFISNFIKDCILSGKQTSDSIVEHAFNLIKNIDDEIKSIENKKIFRSKLLDVVNEFEEVKKDKDLKLLSFFQLKDVKNCKLICDLVKNNPISINDPKIDMDIKYTIKQLLNYNILSRSNNYIMHGDYYDEYVKFLSKEIL